MVGGHVWLLQGACMVAPGGHAWLLGGVCMVALGGVHGCLGGMRGCSGGMHGCSGGTHAWLLQGGVCGCSGVCAWLCNGFEFRDYFCKQHIMLHHVF